jgi:hypothetical protein
MSNRIYTLKTFLLLTCSQFLCKFLSFSSGHLMLLSCQSWREANVQNVWLWRGHSASLSQKQMISCNDFPHLNQKLWYPPFQTTTRFLRSNMCWKMTSYNSEITQLIYTRSCYRRNSIREHHKKTTWGKHVPRWSHKSMSSWSDYPHLQQNLRISLRSWSDYPHLQQNLRISLTSQTRYSRLRLRSCSSWSTEIRFYSREIISGVWTWHSHSRMISTLSFV